MDEDTGTSRKRRKRDQNQNLSQSSTISDESNKTRDQPEVVDLTQDDTIIIVANANQRHNQDVITIDDSPDILESPRRKRAPIPPSLVASTTTIRTPQAIQRPAPPRPTTPPNTLKCPICIESYVDVKKRGLKIVVTRCGHIFCDFCLKKAISDNGRKCPKCRKNIPKGVTGIIEIFDSRISRMGVEGLLTFIRSNDDLLIKNHRLHHTKIVIDANNLTSFIIRRSDKYRNSDLVGVNFNKFGRQVERFIEALQKCSIEPIFMFDGALTKEACKSKRKKKPTRQDKHRDVIESTDPDQDSEIQLLEELFKSIAVDKKVKVAQCSYKADEYVARLANQLRCPAMSSDSDFFILELNDGVIPIEMLDYDRVRLSVSKKTTSGEEAVSTEGSEVYHYIQCCKFTQDNFVQFFPNLDKRCLPLLGILAGNDIVSKRKFAHLTDLLPVHEICEKSGLEMHELRSLRAQQLKILKTLYYMSGKSLEQNINLLVARVAKEKRKDLKTSIKDGLRCYILSPCDDFEKEITYVE